MEKIVCEIGKEGLSHPWGLLTRLLKGLRSNSWNRSILPAVPDFHRFAKKGRMVDDGGMD